MQLEQIETIQPFFEQYRDAQKVQYDTNKNLLDEQRRQQQASIMSQANTAGMLYSNFPQRTQIQYDTNTYMPALTNLRSSYQSGLDSIRNQGVNLANQIRYYQDAIADLDYATAQKNAYNANPSLYTSLT